MTHSGEFMFTWKKFVCVPTLTSYNNGQTAIHILDPDGQLVIRATTNILVDVVPKQYRHREFVFLKSWLEAEGLPEALERAGVVRLTPALIPAGFSLATVGLLSQPFLKSQRR